MRIPPNKVLPEERQHRRAGGTNAGTNRDWRRVSCSLRLLVFQTHAASGIQKGRNQFDNSRFFFFLRILVFFFFFWKKNPAKSEPRCSSVPASSAGCRVQQTSPVSLENNYRAPRPALAPASGRFGPIFLDSFVTKHVNESSPTPSRKNSWTGVEKPRWAGQLQLTWRGQRRVPPFSPACVRNQCSPPSPESPHEARLASSTTCKTPLGVRPWVVPAENSRSPGLGSPLPTLLPAPKPHLSAVIFAE